MDIEHRNYENLEAAEHWFLRIILRIPCTDEVSTCEVFRRAGVLVLVIWPYTTATNAAASV